MVLVLSTGVFKTELAPLLPRFRDAGFTHLEMVDKAELDDNILDNLRQTSTSYDIEIPNWHLIQESPFQDTHDASREAINRMKRSMERGSRIGAKNHVLHWYHCFTEEKYDAMWRDIVDEWAEYAERLGIRLLMETPPYYSSWRHVSASEVFEFVCNYPPQVMSICVDVNHSNLKEKLPDVIHRVKDRLISLHISDNNGHREQHWLPGQGVIDFPALFESLESVEFDGLFVLEVNPWCENPQDASEINWLYEFGINLLKTKMPYAELPLPLTLNKHD